MANNQINHDIYIDDIQTLIFEMLDKEGMTNVKEYINQQGVNPTRLLFDEEAVNQLRHGLPRRDHSAFKQMMSDFRYVFHVFLPKAISSNINC